MINCYDAFMKNAYIMCSDYKEVRAVCSALSDKGLVWVTKDELDEKSTEFFNVCQEYPIFIKRADTKEGTFVCWSDNLCVRRHYTIWAVKGKEVWVVPFNELTFG